MCLPSSFPEDQRYRPSAGDRDRSSGAQSLQTQRWGRSPPLLWGLLLISGRPFTEAHCRSVQVKATRTVSWRWGRSATPPAPSATPSTPSGTSTASSSSRTSTRTCCASPCSRRTSSRQTVSGRDARRMDEKTGFGVQKKVFKSASFTKWHFSAFFFQISWVAPRFPWQP